MNTPNLELEPLLSAQAQKHVTVNEALARIDAVTQLAVLDRDRLDPPVSPNDGDRYLLPAGATGEWNGHDGKIAAWEDATGGWLFLTPRIGWFVWLADEGKHIVLTDAGWQDTGGDAVSVNPVSGDLLGVNTTADTVNRLAVKTEAALFSHDDVTPGTGDMRLTLNKALPADDTSLTMQTGYSARAQIGLTGDDDLHIKVSDDGSTFREAMVVEAATGTSNLLRARSGSVLIASDAAYSLPTPNPGGLIALTVLSGSNGTGGFPQGRASAILAYDTGGSLLLTTLAIASGCTNMGAATLAGTDGPDGTVNLAVKAGHVVIENRLLGTFTISYAFLL